MNRVFTQLALFNILLWALSSQATTVLEVNVDQLLDGAQVVFEGEVIARESRWNDDGSYINTYVTFRVVDVIKGSLSGDTLVQQFAGGTVGDIGVRVEGMVYPEIGERGIYFLEDPADLLVNPFVGWGQGHFRVQPDSNGEQRVTTERGEPVLDIADPGSTAPMARQTAAPFSRGVARGIHTGQRSDQLDTAMDKQSFKRDLRVRLAPRQSSANQGEQAQ